MVHTSSLMGPFLACSVADSRAFDGLELSVPVAVCAVAPGGPVVTYAGKPLRDHEVLINCLGFVAGSSRGLADIEAVRTSWKARFGADAPSVVDAQGFSDALGVTAAAGAFVVEACLKERRALGARIGDLQRELATMRSSYDETLTAFRALESFIGQTSKASRWIGTVIEPLATRTPLRLKAGDVLKQLLPADSAGLSDVAFFLSSAPPRGRGELRVSLSLVETGQSVGSWQVSGERLKAGWNRFALETSLGVETRTPVLRIDWDGEEPLRVGQSIRHPEERFCVALNGTPGVAVMAVQVWKSVPGVRAPLPPGAHVTDGATALRWSFPEQTLRKVVDLTPVPDQVKFVPEHAGVLVHPIPERASVALLQAAAGEGMRHLVVDAKSIHEAASDIEFAMAIADPDDRPRGPEEVPDFPEAMHSGWVRVKATRSSQLHVILPAPLSGAADIYFMTRVAEKGADTAYGWAIFTNLRATA